MYEQKTSLLNILPPPGPATTPPPLPIKKSNQILLLYFIIYFLNLETKKFVFFRIRILQILKKYFLGGKKSYFLQIEDFETSITRFLLLSSLFPKLQNFNTYLCHLSSIILILSVNLPMIFKQNIIKYKMTGRVDILWRIFDKCGKKS